MFGQFIYGNVKERRRWDQAIPLRCHDSFESLVVFGPLITVSNQDNRNGRYGYQNIATAGTVRVVTCGFL